jgi:hypothetical protein
MRIRRWLTLVPTLIVVSLAGCGGGGNGFGCQGRTCTASFQGPGEQDLSSELGPGATVEVETVDDDSVTARVGGRDVKLLKGEKQAVGAYDVTLTEISGDDVTLRVVGR